MTHSETSFISAPPAHRPLFLQTLAKWMRGPAGPADQTPEVPLNTHLRHDIGLAPAPPGGPSIGAAMLTCLR